MAKTALVVVDIQNDFFAMRQWFLQINAHHGVVDGIGHRIPFGIFDIVDSETAVKFFF